MVIQLRCCICTELQQLGSHRCATLHEAQASGDAVWFGCADVVVRQQRLRRRVADWQVLLAAGGCDAPCLVSSPGPSSEYKQ